MNSIITFYSFKGGVGRSMALANIAYLLAAQNTKRVLCVDWDLEAPGLEKYFGGCPGAVIRTANKGGLVDLLISAYEGLNPDWRDYVSTVTFGDRMLELISSGNRDSGYAAKVLGFDWHLFFEKAAGGAFIESLRDAWHENFETTLIDSRTGFTDSGGVCTVQLPDILVPVFTTTEESAKGAIDVIDRAQQARQKLAYDRSPLLIFPLPSRYDGRTQYNEAREWLNRFAEWFKVYYADWLPADVSPLQIIERTKLPYIGYFSFGTQMPAAIEGTSDPESLGFAYNVAATIISGEFQGVERLTASVPKTDGQPSRSELALFRMRRVLLEKRYAWRSIDTLAGAAGIGITEALDVLRGEPEVDFGRGESGRVIVRIRENPVSAREKFLSQRAAARGRFEDLNPSKNKACEGYFESSFFPDLFDRTRFSLSELREAAIRGEVNVTGWPFLYSDPEHTYVIEDGIETLFQALNMEFSGDELLDFWRLHQSGFLYHRTAMRPAYIRAGTTERCILDFRTAAVQIAKSIRCLTHLYEGLLSSDDEVSFVLTLLGTENRILSSSGMPHPGKYVCRIREIFVERKLSLENWRNGLVDRAVEIANEVYLRFNWPTPNLEAARAAIESTTLKP